MGRSSVGRATVFGIVGQRFEPSRPSHSAKYKAMLRESLLTMNSKSYITLVMLVPYNLAVILYLLNNLQYHK